MNDVLGRSSSDSGDVNRRRLGQPVPMTKIRNSNAPHPPVKRFGLIALALGVGLVLAACGSSGAVPPTYCENLNSLKGSVKAVGDVNVVESGTSGLQSALTQVKNDAAAVQESAGEEFATQTSQLKSSVDQLTSTAGDLKSSPSTTGLAQLKTDAAAVGASMKDLAESAKCD